MALYMDVMILSIVQKLICISIVSGADDFLQKLVIYIIKQIFLNDYLHNIAFVVLFGFAFESYFDIISY